MHALIFPLHALLAYEYDWDCFKQINENATIFTICKAAIKVKFKTNNYVSMLPYPVMTAWLQYFSIQTNSKILISHKIYESKNGKICQVGTFRLSLQISLCLYTQAHICMRKHFKIPYILVYIKSIERAQWNGSPTLW